MGSEPEGIKKVHLDTQTNRARGSVTRGTSDVGDGLRLQDDFTVLLHRLPQPGQHCRPIVLHRHLQIPLQPCATTIPFNRLAPVPTLSFTNPSLDPESISMVYGPA